MLGGTHSCHPYPDLALTRIPPESAVAACRARPPLGSLRCQRGGSCRGWEPARGLSGLFLDWASRSEHPRVSQLGACQNRTPQCLCGTCGVAVAVRDEEPASWPRPGVRTVMPQTRNAQM